ncbi:tocopherol cyclase family protein [Clostridium sp. CF012]|uniref:tocopherol cyclase family protein n=1 Tax=Clostridium sp. CF012 TaxID=2843319 RepID=UPI001C0D3729|nr:tocopherol cyclase family protein [Clostridium sp. CF012]MBU3143751.1 tocopherol cyclase family protein [Clostridium sp. CF012]
MIKSILNPDLYHGNSRTSNFFEGWYFKLVDKNMANVISLIPGIYLGKSKENSHSFIQLLQGNKVSYKYKKFTKDEFISKSNNRLNISVANNNFSLNEISLNINDGSDKITGSICFTNLLKWPDSTINPGSMGYYNFIPRMQCYSQVSVMDMDLEGSLNINGSKIDFSGGKGYIEKNWGSAFPYSWTWVQCNSFKNRKASISCSIGHIPFMITSFRGFLIGLFVDDKFYKFTTINKSTLNIVQNALDIIITTENKKYKLIIETKTNKSDFMLCMGPRDDKMLPLVEESLKASVKVTLIDKSTSKTIFCENVLCCGIEYGGDQRMILK